jgi:hypothetical protein
VFAPEEVTFCLWIWPGLEKTQLEATYRGRKVWRLLPMAKDNVDFPICRRRAEQEMTGALYWMFEGEAV